MKYNFKYLLTVAFVQQGEFPDPQRDSANQGLYEMEQNHFWMLGLTKQRFGRCIVIPTKNNINIKSQTLLETKKQDDPAHF